MAEIIPFPSHDLDVKFNLRQWVKNKNLLDSYMEEFGSRTGIRIEFCTVGMDVARDALRQAGKQSGRNIGFRLGAGARLRNCDQTNLVRLPVPERPNRRSAKRTARA